MRVGLLVLPLALLAGCAATQPDVQTADANGGAVCTRETPIGSTITKTVCHQPLTAEERQQLQDGLNSQIRSGATQPGGKGG